MFAQVVVEEIFLEAESHNFELAGSILRRVERIFRFQGCGGSTEVAFQKLANATKDSQSLRLSPCTLWRRPTLWHLFDETYKFKEAGASVITDDDLVKAELPTTLYAPAYKRTTMNFRDLPGTSSPSWPSWSASRFNALAGNVAMSRYCYENQC